MHWYKATWAGATAADPDQAALSGYRPMLSRLVLHIDIIAIEAGETGR